MQAPTGNQKHNSYPLFGVGIRVPFEQHGHALSSGSASRHQTQLTIFAHQPVGSVHAEPNASGRKRMANRERSTPVVPLVQIWGSDLLAETEIVLAEVVRVEGFQVGNNLTL